MPTTPTTDCQLAPAIIALLMRFTCCTWCISLLIKGLTNGSLNQSVCSTLCNPPFIDLDSLAGLLGSLCSLLPASFEKPLFTWEIFIHMGSLHWIFSHEMVSSCYSYFHELPPFTIWEASIHLECLMLCRCLEDSTLLWTRSIIIRTFWIMITLWAF